MLTRCSLDAHNGFRFDLIFERVIERSSIDNEVYLKASLELAFDSSLSNIIVKSEHCAISSKDLRDLISYLKTHMQVLQKQADIESTVFVAQELAFQLQGLSGETWINEDGLLIGEFTLSVLANIGSKGSGYPRIYVGGQSLVMFEDVNAFIDSLVGFMSELEIKKNL